MSFLVHVLRQKFNPPQPVTEPFTGKTILLTGANTGLGFEAAKKIAALNPDKLIITARNAAKAEQTKKAIEASLRGAATSKSATLVNIQTMILDMGDFKTVRAFVQELESKVSHLDAAILNAGLSSGQYILTQDGWETALHVNAISTTLLGLLLLPLMRRSAEASGSPTHLTFVSSGLAATAKPESYQPFFDAPNSLEKMNEKESFPGQQGRYAQSKVLLEYSMRHIAQLPITKSSNATSLVIVGSVCPGLCKSELGREITGKSILLSGLVNVFFFLFARTAEQGANSYLSAIQRGMSSNGELWKDDKIFTMGPMQTGEQGKRFGDKIWGEISAALRGVDPKVEEVLKA